MELFGVFGDRGTFEEFRSPEEFHAVLDGDDVTVGVRDPWLSVPGRTTYCEDEGLCVVWGEAFGPTARTPARLLASRYGMMGRDAFDAINGSYVAVVEHDGEAVVGTDPIRSWDCFYADVDGTRLFGTDCGALANLVAPRPHRDALREFLYLGSVLGDRTLFEGIRRVPFDGYLTADGGGEFDRFVYGPDSFDYAEELAERLRRALDRRSDYPGRKGVLLSAGQDSRSVLTEVPDVDHCYTLGRPDADEVRIARRLAAQYDAAHTVLEPDAEYLAAHDGKARYTGSVRESLHAHHAGYDDRLDVDTIYHGLLYDTLLKGYFLERAEVGPTPLQRKRPEDDVDPVEGLLSTLGFRPGGYGSALDCTDAVPDVGVDDPGSFIRERIEAELSRCRRRVESPHNLMDLFAVRNQPAMTFRTHLADNYLEAHVATDVELLDWHLRTPPRHRHPETVHDALSMLDDEIFRHRPPDRPHRSELLNQLDGFAHRKLPFLSGTEAAWPDRQRLYEEHDLDEYFFPDCPGVADVSVRRKLRVADARWWLSSATHR